MTSINPYFQQIFPSGNRNAGGPFYFHFIETNGLPETLHKSYCGVSGSPIDISKPPATIKVQNLGSDTFVCGGYHNCCWPCLCDAMRFTKAETLGEKTVLTIPDPCQNKKALAGIREVSRFVCDAEGKTKDVTHTASGRVVVAVLQDPHVCVDSEVSSIMGTCTDRDNTAVEDLQGGMGDIFAKIATIGGD